MRGLVLLWRLGPLAASFLRDRRRWFVAGRPMERTAHFHELRAERCVAAIAQLGPSFVKLAQVFSARSDLIPEPYVTVLSTLTDQVPPVPTPLIEHEIERAFGAPVGTLFERFEAEPLAAASLGQVHRARYRGEEVVVKVLRPGVERLVRQDLGLALPMARWIERHFPNAHIRNTLAVLEEFGTRIWEEMDFVREAANARQIAANFRGTRRVIIPRVIDAMTRPRVLVLEYVEGTRIDRLVPRRGDPAHDPQGVVSAVMELYLRMMLVHGLFHADPHPGNLLVAPDGRIVLLDFGMVIPVPRELRWRLVSTVFAAIRRDVDGVVAGLSELGVLDPAVDVAEFRPLAQRLMAIAYDPGSMQERIQLVANEVMATLYDWPVRLPSELVYFARTSALIEGLGVRYDPYFNPITFASPIALRMRGEILRSLGRDVPAPDAAALVGAALGHAAAYLLKTGRALASRLLEGWDRGPPTAPDRGNDEWRRIAGERDVPKLLAGD